MTPTDYRETCAKLQASIQDVQEHIEDYQEQLETILRTPEKDQALRDWIRTAVVQFAFPPWRVHHEHITYSKRAVYLHGNDRYNEKPFESVVPWATIESAWQQFVEGNYIARRYKGTLAKELLDKLRKKELAKLRKSKILINNIIRANNSLNRYQDKLAQVQNIAIEQWTNIAIEAFVSMGIVLPELIGQGCYTVDFPMEYVQLNSKVTGSTFRMPWGVFSEWWEENCTGVQK